MRNGSVLGSVDGSPFGGRRLAAGTVGFRDYRKREYWHEGELAQPSEAQRERKRRSGTGRTSRSGDGFLNDTPQARGIEAETTPDLRHILFNAPLGVGCPGSTAEAKRLGVVG